MTREGLFAAVRPFAPGQKFTADAVGRLDALADLFGLPAANPVRPPASATSPEITERAALELVGHEAIVREAYKDSVGVWTWGIGVTSASGHAVDGYKDNPQSIARCLEVFIWLLRARYAPAVLRAFEGCLLTEAQFAAALSFHYNTGAIGRADWVQSWRAGRVDRARAEFMNWRSPPAIVGRRTKERDLFFDGTWSEDGHATVYPVRKPSYAPNFAGGQRVDIRADLKAALGATEQG